ncbi:MAG: hypothetical protein LUF00_05970 [Lachnospiraceae bacterium]|nr:hypothetical protein [Lachnospiraceae bacterium]
MSNNIIHERFQQEELDLLCFANDITESFPPVFFMTGTGDFMQDETPILHRKLLEKQIPFVFRFYGDSFKKPLGHVFHCNIRLEDSVLCNTEECEFFRRFL